MKIFAIAASAAISVAVAAWAIGTGVFQSKTANPIEFGTVKWSRNFDSALAAAKKQNKPLLILFQEVPG